MPYIPPPLFPPKGGGSVPFTEVYFYGVLESDVKTPDTILDLTAKIESHPSAYASGVYTVPIDGVYLVTGVVLCKVDETDDAVDGHVSVGDKNLGFYFFRGEISGTYMESAKTITLSLLAGDTISMTTDSNANTKNFVSGAAVPNDYTYLNIRRINA